MRIKLLSILFVLLLTACFKSESKVSEATITHNGSSSMIIDDEIPNTILLQKIEDITKAINSTPDKARLYIVRANLKCQIGDYVSAKLDLNKAQTLMLTDKDKQYLLYVTAIYQIEQEKNYQDAVDNLSKIIAEKPSDNNFLGSVSFYRGQAHYALRNYGAASHDYDNVIGHVDDDSPLKKSVYLNSALVMSILKKTDLAYLFYAKSIELSQNAPEFLWKPYFGRASLQMDLELYQKAVNDYTKVISLIPDNDYHKMRSYTSRGEAYLSLKQGKKACSDFRAAYAMANEIGEQEEAKDVLSYMTDYNCNFK